jgi:hypothetical protein
MAIRDYITLDSLKYHTPAKAWEPVPNRPISVRRTLLGAADAAFGPISWREWQGDIRAPVTAEAAGWGTIANLRTSLAKRQALAFVDHYGNACNVVVMGPFPERSIMNVWDDPANSFFVTVALVEA